MSKDIFDSKVTKVLLAAQQAFIDKNISQPYPSPDDWRSQWIYMLMIDRFNNPEKQPNGTWNKNYAYRHSGTFNGIREQLDYIKELGAGAIWLTPVLQNSRGEGKYNYHGYNTQDFLKIDGRYASDGNSDTAEKELIELVKASHGKGLYVILDIVLNHTGQVFNYFRNGKEEQDFKDSEILYSPPLSSKEQPIKWMKWDDTRNENFAFWEEDNLPPSSHIGAYDVIFPFDLQRKDFFRRRGTKTREDVSPGEFVKGDLGIQRQLVVEYYGNENINSKLYRKYGDKPVLNILIRIHQYLIAKYDIDGFRIDTAKHVDPSALQIFGNAIREYALSIGKRNFFTFGEINAHSEEVVASFVGRNTRIDSSSEEGFGIDAALDFPLFYNLPDIVKGFSPVSVLFEIFEKRKQQERELLSSHGEAGRFFVTFIDNHDASKRFYNKDICQQYQRQLTLGLGILFCLPGIPCLYYGTEQGLRGTLDGDPSAGFQPENVREALWGKDWEQNRKDAAFNRDFEFYREIQKLSEIRIKNPSLCYGRIYFREVSGNGQDFGHSQDIGGIIAFSRILALQEIVIVANTNTIKKFPYSDNDESDATGYVLVALDTSNRLHEEGKFQSMELIYSNCRPRGQATNIEVQGKLIFWDRNNNETTGRGARLPISLKPMEIQIWKSI